MYLSLTETVRVRRAVIDPACDDDGNFDLTSLVVESRSSLDQLGTLEVVTSRGGVQSIATVGTHTFSGPLFEDLEHFDIVQVKAGFFADNTRIDDIQVTKLPPGPAPAPAGGLYFFVGVVAGIGPGTGYASGDIFTGYLDWDPAAPVTDPDPFSNGNATEYGTGEIIVENLGSLSGTYAGSGNIRVVDDNFNDGSAQDQFLMEHYGTSHNAFVEFTDPTGTAWSTQSLSEVSGLLDPVGQFGNATLRIGDFLDEMTAVITYVRLTGVSATSVPDAGPNTRFVLHDASPNPFNPSARISYEILAPGTAQLKIYTVDGRLVDTVLDGHLEAGPGTVTWDGKDAGGRQAASGIYLYEMRSGGVSETRRMVLLK